MSSIYTNSWPLCSSKIQRAQTVSEQVLQKYSTFLSKWRVQLVNKSLISSPCNCPIPSKVEFPSLIWLIIVSNCWFLQNFSSCCVFISTLHPSLGHTFGLLVSRSATQNSQKVWPQSGKMTGCLFSSVYWLPQRSQLMYYCTFYISFNYKQAVNNQYRFLSMSVSK